MKTLVVVGHPHPNDSYTQRFFYESMKPLESVTWLPIEETTLDTQVEQERLKQYDRIILQFPVYWYSCPWQLKRWIDCVFDTKYLDIKGKELGIVATFATNEKHYAAGGQQRFTVSEMLRPFEMMAHSLGMIYLPAFCVHQMMYKDDEEKMRLAINYQRYVVHKKDQTFTEQCLAMLKDYAGNELVKQDILDGLAYLEELQDMLVEVKNE